MRVKAVLSAFLASGVARAATSSILFSGGTIIAFNKSSESLEVIRNGSVLASDGRIASVFSSTAAASFRLPAHTEHANSPHGWQTSLKTLGSNTSLVEYFGTFAFVASTGLVAADDVGARVFWSYGFLNSANFQVQDQLASSRNIATRAPFKGTATNLGIAYGGFGPNPNVGDAAKVMGLAKEFNVSVVTTHSLQGPWAYENSPENVHALGYLDTSIPFIFSHASFLTATATGATLLRQTNQFVSITPESEMHYGHTHPYSHQAALGVDTHFTFSADIVTQARYGYKRPWQVAKRNFKIAESAFPKSSSGFLASARRVQQAIIEQPFLVMNGNFFSGYELASAVTELASAVAELASVVTADTPRGEGDDYGDFFRA
ncbi:hypothetical protein B0T26DRAFT_813813 [Lasiosphaeria miniovina]|uniref:Uncharacterized protein n=1 Tax=Lasiosphaeria miniovina TaxID=1954250 RepID=A0AA40DSS9_9PEZI|nr:uncharacterized protein B0T26DRAFT_813813 [Lasiosphaeria miniovina]KAK0714185.1 hypothetical protein B0T26DRAFT_813813 [Lasiosphaeria miniovina]